MPQRQGFPLHDATIWVEDLGSKQYRVWYAHNGAPHKHYNECVTSHPVNAVQENRAQVLRIYERHAQGTTPAVMRAQRVKTYSTWAYVLLFLALPLAVLLACLAELGPSSVLLTVFVVLCFRRLV